MFIKLSNSINQDTNKDIFIMQDLDMSKAAIIILAAGQGKRMKNPDLPKVLCPMSGKPLIQYVIETADRLNIKKVAVIVGHQREKLTAFLNEKFPNCETCVQDKQLGTGHAVAQAEPLFEDFRDDILILSGDVPLISEDTLKKFYQNHIKANADVSALTTIADNPFGYGRIIRNSEGFFQKIVEQKDATPEEQAVQEINSGIYLIKARLLFTSLKYVSNNNEQGEYYLTDIIEILRHNGAIVRAFALAEFDELQGVNSPDDLLRAEAAYAKALEKNVSAETSK
jgi:UDP-N-acetylglucosamine diphosphorylase/glucosamine-1-phosphate N-acetyltransferase